MPAVHSRKGKGRAMVPEEPVAVLPLGKQLAHTDKKVRDRAVQNLAAFLSRGAGDDDSKAESSEYIHLSETEMSKLWKGLFYCFWMSDKPLIQQALASELANLLLAINPKPSHLGLTDDEKEDERFRASLGFLEGFWKCMIREWGGIDRLRMDKFYLLIRRFVNATFRLLARTGWRGDAVGSVNLLYSVMGGPMTYEDPRVPHSIATHLSDIYLEELDKVLALPEVNSQPAAPLIPLLQPFTLLLTRSPQPTIHTRLMSSIYIPLLKALSSAGKTSEGPLRADEPVYAHIVLGSTVGDSGVEPRSSPEEVRKAVLAMLFRFAADEKSLESSRRKVYKFWREEGGDEDEE